MLNICSRHDVSDAFKERNAGLVKGHKKLLYTGIVTRDCFEVLFSHNKNRNDTPGKFDMDDIWHFLVAFNLATEIKKHNSLYIPALIPDFKESHLKRRTTEISKGKLTLGFYYSFEKCDEVFGLFNKLLSQLASSKHF